MKIKNNIAVAKVEGLNYSGQIVVKVLSGNKVISKHTYHNSGRETLFKFLSLALSGNYIERQRPCQIKLFLYTPALQVGDAPTNFDWETAFETDLTTPKGITPFITYDTTPVVSRKQLDDYATYRTTYHFRIPFTLISNAADNTTLGSNNASPKTVIHMAGLYPINTVFDKEASAYYLFTNDDGTEWQPIEIADNAGNFSMVIDWVLTFQNAALTKEEAQKLEED